MVTQESRFGSFVRGVGNFILFLLAVAVLLGIGYVYWPKVKAEYYDAGAATQAQPTTAPRPAPPAEPLRIIVQTVPQGEPAQNITVSEPAQPTTPPSDPPSAPPAEPPARPIVIVEHQTDYGHPVITGSGACQVAKCARRCGR